MEKSNATIVWTDTAMGIMATAMMPMALSNRCHCFGVPRHPRLNNPYARLRNPVLRSRRSAKSGIIGKNRNNVLAVM